MHRFQSLVAFALLTVVAVAEPASAAPGCPGAVLFQPDASGAVVDAGWTGIAHEMPVLGYSMRLATSCSASAPPCGTCAITGLVPNAGGNNLRCRNDTSIQCTVATEVADCGGANRCRFFLSPPTGIATGGITTCYTSEVTGPAGGTVNVDTGAASIDVPMQVPLYISPSIDHPCPRCIGDPISNDNTRSGVCNEGARNGLACDANANAPAGYPDFGSTSFDCPPTPGALISTFVLGTVTFATDPQDSTLTAASPPCTASGYTSLACHCETCNNINAPPCATNADCPPSGGNPGICGGRRCFGGTNVGGPCTAHSACPGGFCSVPGELTRPNGCVDDTTLPGFQLCEDTAPVGDAKGTCPLGPIDHHCTVASGHAQRGCFDDTDCGGTPGSCDVFLRPCYLDNGVIGGKVEVAGIATPPVGNTSEPTVLGALACLASTSAGSVNAVGGFPGLGRTTQPGRLTFAEEVVVQNTPPGGTATTNGSGPASVVETSVTTPSGGEVTIIGTFNAGSPPLGYEFLGRLVQITAPMETPGNPLHVTFTIAASEVPSGGVSAIDIFRNGTGPAPECPGATQAIPDDPCVTARAALGGGDVSITVLTSAASDWTMAAAVSDAGKCAAAKEKCVAKRGACLLGCHAKAESTGIPVDPTCVQKCEGKFDGGAVPSKGCFAKLEAKLGCATTGDSPALAATTDAFVLDAVTQVDPGYPAPVSNKCSAGKKKCISKNAACKLGCYAKSHSKGVAVDHICLGKCEDKLDGGSDPAKGCFAKLESKYPGQCLTTNDTTALATTVDAFVGDVVCQLHGPSDGTCP